MFNEKDYQAAFSKVTASEDTRRRIMEFPNEKQKNGKGVGTVIRVVVVAAILASLTLTAFAAENTIEVRDWFLAFFASNEEEAVTEEITYNQQRILSDGLLNVNQSATCNGYTVTLESAISDGYKAYLKFRIEAPEGVVLDGDGYSLQEYPTAVAVSGEKTDPNDDSISAATAKCIDLDDADPKDNCVMLLMEILAIPSKSSDATLIKNTEWTFTLTEIWERRRDCETGYRVLAEGAWDFSFSFDEKSFMEDDTEILTKPIRISAKRCIRDREMDVKLKVTSFRIRALTATMIYEEPLTGYWEGIRLENIYVGLKDGTKILAHWRMGTNQGDGWKDQFDFDCPVAAEDIDYVEFPGYGKYYVNQEGIS